MSFGIYKRGQGRWSRGVAAAALSAMGIWAAISTYRWMENYEEWARFAVPGVILLGFLWFAYYLSNRPKTASFLIETEVEMKKVTWPTGREVLSATFVVIVVVLIMGAFLFGIDRYGLEPAFKAIGILPGEVSWWELGPPLGLVVAIVAISLGASKRS